MKTFSIEDTLTHEDLQKLLAVSGPVALNRHEDDQSRYKVATFMGSGVSIKQYRGCFYAQRRDGIVIALGSDIDELIHHLRKLDVL
ncbi:MAG: hypothetical protein Q7R40_15045 [Phaeospirillum sp.]|nr:hypothetical protein [Phaeospirillum sp.]